MCSLIESFDDARVSTAMRKGHTIRDIAISAYSDKLRRQIKRKLGDVSSINHRPAEETGVLKVF